MKKFKVIYIGSDGTLRSKEIESFGWYDVITSCMSNSIYDNQIISV